MSYSDREPGGVDQIREAQEAYEVHRRSEAFARGFESEFVWVPGADGDRLQKLSPSGDLQKDFGLRDARSEMIAAGYLERKAAALEDLAIRTLALRRMERLNTAHGVGRLLATPINVLAVLLRRGIMDYYSVIGTYAMYAYEAAAGVVFDDPTMATNDVDLFLTAHKQMKFAQLIDAETSMVDVLKEADPTFERNEEQKESAINSDGFSVSRGTSRTLSSRAGSLTCVMPTDRILGGACSAWMRQRLLHRATSTFSLAMSTSMRISPSGRYRTRSSRRLGFTRAQSMEVETSSLYGGASRH